MILLNKLTDHPVNFLDDSRFSEELMESENDRMMETLAGKVSSMRYVSYTL